MSLWFGGFRDNSGTSLDSPSEDNLSWSLTVLGGNLSNDSLGENGILGGCHIEFNIRWCTQIAKSGDSDSLFLAESNKLLLGIVRMEFYLKDSWFDFGITKDLSEENTVHVADTDVLNKAFLNKLLKGLPCFLDWDEILLHSWISARWIMNPLWWIPGLEWNELQRNREMDKVKIKVLQS